MIELVDWLKAEYGFTKVEFCSEAIILTDQGRKRIRSWSDSSLLDWHIEWRDHCHRTPVVLTDRMIRTKEEKPAAKWRDRWISIHDEVDEEYPQLEHEHAWGMLIGLMIEHGIKDHHKIRPIQRERLEYEVDPNWFKGLRKDIKDQLEKYQMETSDRAKKARAIRTKLSDVQLPVIDPIESTTQARKVYDVLLWRGTSEQAEIGYYSIRQFLIQWQKENGQGSLYKLIQAIGQTDGFCRKQALLLVAECLEPYEWLNVKHTIETNESEQRIESALNEMTEEWEEARKLVQLIGKWIDEQKKVLS
ncbi:hypothetical protein [Bacillus sp. FJAT-45037]|uniref:hypothetical protein n=1 Tax=Bacillus sp. FJAT-45037 TaxID=2011007 RepID=UPI000C24B32C|nr:hypothetical protein [Bacillus sp. FJAT-45037]